MRPSKSKLVFQSHVPPPPPPHPHLRCSPGCWERILPRLPRWWHPGRISPGSPPSVCGTAPTLSSTPPWESEEEEEVVREWKEAAGSCGLSYSLSEFLDKEWEETKICDCFKLVLEVNAYLKDSAPTGRTMNSCMASLLPAWEPPFITLKAWRGEETKERRGEETRYVRFSSLKGSVNMCGSHLAFITNTYSRLCYIWNNQMFVRVIKV